MSDLDSNPNQNSGTTQGHEPHIVPVSMYLSIFTALLVLTGVTVAASYVNLDAMLFGAGTASAVVGNTVALLIATTKATLVVLFFMHLKYSPKLTWVVVISALVWLAVLLCITMSDYLTRGWLT